MAVYHIEYIDTDHVRLTPELTDSRLETAAVLWETDPHQFSTRPCPTCRSLSALLGRSFGCDAKAGR